jgi:hypothetical protein
MEHDGPENDGANWHVAGAERPVTSIGAHCADGPRVFNNARAATRNLDLPLAIGDPIATQLFLLHRWILASAWRPQWRVFLGPKFGPKLRKR